MKAPQLIPAEAIKARIVGTDRYYPVEVQVRGWNAYSEFIQKLLHNYEHLFAEDANGKKILAKARSIAMLIANHDRTVDSLEGLFARVDEIRSDIVAYVKALSAVDDIKLAIQSEIVAGFKNATRPATASFLRSVPQKLYQEISAATTLEEVSAAWISFKEATKITANDYLAEIFTYNTPAPTPVSLSQKVREIDDLFLRQAKRSEGIAQMVEIIDTIATRIDLHDATIHQEREQEETFAATHETLRQYSARDIASDQKMVVTDDASKDILLMLEQMTSSGGTVVRTIRLVAPHNAHPINNRDSFGQHGFSRKTLLAVFTDMYATGEQESLVNNVGLDTDTHVTNPRSLSNHTELATKAASAKTAWWKTIGKNIGDKWNELKNQFSLANLRHNRFVAAGFALFLGLAAHSGKADHKVAHVDNPAPITIVTATHIVEETPAPVVTNIAENQTVVTRASTSEGSRYSVDSHNHNTDETLQRMVKAMGFNSVQTKVIATRLDTQLRAARNIQAPDIHTQVNQNVVMEELNGQVRLSVQDAAGHPLYGTSWFAREIGFRNFQPRR